MEVSTLRKEIHEFVDEADDRFLRLVHGMILAEKKNSSISKRDEMNRRAELSEKDIDEGRVKTFDEFDADFEQWKKQKRASMK